jgi:hypothetical protein
MQWILPRSTTVGFIISVEAKPLIKSLDVEEIMIKRISLFIFFLLFSFSITALAHVDRIINIKNGELIGLPEKYQPAFLDLQNKSLRIGNNKFEFPPCISKYFPNGNQYDIKITSSWYHDLSEMPPYLSILIQPLGKDYGFDLLFNMDTLKLIKIEIVIHESNKVTSYHQVLIDKMCMKSINNSYVKIKK